MSTDELKETKEYKKAKKTMTDEIASEFLKKEAAELKDIISRNTVYVKAETEKMKNHPEYVKATQIKKDLDSGMNEALAPYKAAADWAAKILKERG